MGLRELMRYEAEEREPEKVNSLEIFERVNAFRFALLSLNSHQLSQTHSTYLLLCLTLM